MAEPFSIATGALQVAGAGIQLAKTLYDYAQGVRNAEKEINNLAREVKLISSVLQNLATALKQDEARQLCSASLHVDAREALLGCTHAFKELNNALSMIRRPASKGLVGISFGAKIRWPLNKSRMAELQANLERLKTTLLLMLHVLIYASKRLIIPQQDPALDVDRQRIDRLIKSNEELYASLINGNGMVNKGVQSTPGGERGFSPDVTSSNDSASIDRFSVASDPEADHVLEDDVTRRFRDCLDAVRELDASLGTAIASWRSGRDYQVENVTDAYAAVRRLTLALPRHFCTQGTCCAAFPSIDDLERHMLTGQHAMEALRARPDLGPAWGQTEGGRPSRGKADVYPWRRPNNKLKYGIVKTFSARSSNIAHRQSYGRTSTRRLPAHRVEDADSESDTESEDYDSDSDSEGETVVSVYETRSAEQRRSRLSTDHLRAESVSGATAVQDDTWREYEVPKDKRAMPLPQSMPERSKVFRNELSHGVVSAKSPRTEALDNLLLRWTNIGV